MDENDCESTGVIICGGGPTGALLSALLGRMNVPNVVLERESDITTDPRGIALDEDGIRLIQAIGMYERVHTRIGQCEHQVIDVVPRDIANMMTGQETRFISGTDTDLMKPPFFSFKLSTSDGGTGHVGLIFHKQPELERAIRDAILQCPCSELRTNTTLSSISENTQGIQVEYVDQNGAKKQLRASFLVGADGKTGFVRKRYLEPRGVLLERVPGYVDPLPNYYETSVTESTQHKLRRNLGSSKLPPTAPNTHLTPCFPTLGGRLHTPASLRSLLPPGLPLPLQSGPPIRLRKIRPSRRQALEIRVCGPQW